LAAFCSFLSALRWRRKQGQHKKKEKKCEKSEMIVL
jgi:hypothetical protein